MNNKHYLTTTSKDYIYQQPPPPPPTLLNNELILFFHPYNFASQKIQLVLYEKNIPFTSYPMDIANGEQFSLWFLKLNPKGDVPVLKDNEIVICNSISIIEHLETKYSGGNYIGLRHLDYLSNPKLEETFHRLNALPIGVLSLGSFIHEDLNLTPKPPFVGQARQSLLKNNEHIYQLLETTLELHAQSNKLTSNMQQSLQSKLQLFQKRQNLAYSRKEYQHILNLVGDVLISIEKELRDHPNQKWLIDDKFTLLDIHFGVLLVRLYQLGLENHYWSYGKLSNIESYFLRFCKRSSIQKLCPTAMMVFKGFWQRISTTYKLNTTAGILAMGVIAVCTHALVHK